MRPIPRSAPARCLRAAALGLLAASVLLLAACGGGEGKISESQGDELTNTLEQAKDYYDNGRCDEADAELDEAQGMADDLDVDPEIQDGLDQLMKRLDDQLSDCEPEEEETTTDTTSSVEEPTTTDSVETSTTDATSTSTTDSSSTSTTTSTNTETFTTPPAPPGPPDDDEDDGGVGGGIDRQNAPGQNKGPKGKMKGHKKPKPKADKQPKPGEGSGGVGGPG